MTGAGAQLTARPGGARPWGGLLADRHFLAAALILAASAAGWNAWVRVAKLATVKYPVPWPAGVVVDDGFRMTWPGAEGFGPYKFISGKGTPEAPGGLGPMTKENLELLKIGTGPDERNRGSMRSNWFMIRNYEYKPDKGDKPPVRHMPRYWRLEMYYYTGGVDRVPHVPEICAVMGGATYLGTSELPVTIPSAPAPWGGKAVNFQKALFQANDARGAAASQFAQYYIFSLNGAPEGSRTTVRLTLASPFVRHAYFAKIQFCPWTDLPDPAEADEAARDFAAHFLPEVLKALPTPEDIRKLDQSAGDSR